MTVTLTQVRKELARNTARRSRQSESADLKCQRMAQLITGCVTGSGAITRDQLLASFSEEEIAIHFRPALRRAGLHRLGDTL